MPKFGDWDVNNPASAEGFTVIFSKARDEKKSNSDSGAKGTAQRNGNLSTKRPEGAYEDLPMVRKINQHFIE